MYQMGLLNLYSAKSNSLLSLLPFTPFIAMKVLISLECDDGKVNH